MTDRDTPPRFDPVLAGDSSAANRHQRISAGTDISDLLSGVFTLCGLVRLRTALEHRHVMTFLLILPRHVVPGRKPTLGEGATNRH